MTEISPSLLLSPDTQPANGTNTGKAIAWYGGDLSVIFSGVFSGATFQLLMTPVMPPNGKIPAVPTDWIADADWIALGAPVAAASHVDYGHINPCMLAIKTASTASGTRVRALLA